MAKEILLKRSSVEGKEPAVSGMSYGELFINYASGEGKSFLTTKKADDTIAKFMEKSYNDAHYANKDVVDNIEEKTQENTDAISGLTDEIIKTERVIANTLNTINQSAGFDENGNSTLGKSLTDAIKELQDSNGGSTETLDNLQNQIDGIKDEISDLTDDIDAVDGKIKTLEENVDTKISGLTDNITRVENDIKNLQNKDIEISNVISGIQETVTDIQDGIDGLQTELDDAVKDLNDYINTKVSSAYIFKGSVNTFNDLPKEGLTNGDVYNVAENYNNHPAGTNWAWVAPKTNENGDILEEGYWDALAGIVDLSGYATTGTTASLQDQIDEISNDYVKNDDLTTAIDGVNSKFDNYATTATTSELSNKVAENTSAITEINKSIEDIINDVDAISKDYITTDKLVGEIEKIDDKFSGFTTTGRTEEIAVVVSANTEAISNINENINDFQNEIDAVDKKISGNTVAISGLTEEIIKTERVIAHTINTINQSAGFNENGESTLDDGESLTDAIKNIQTKNGEIEGNLSNLQNTVDTISSDYVTTTELNDAVKIVDDKLSGFTPNEKVNEILILVSANTDSISAINETINTIQSDYDNLSTKVEDNITNISGLTDEIIKTERVIANTLNTINQSAGFNENGESTLDSGMTLTDAIKALQAKDVEIKGTISDIQDKVDEMDSEIQSAVTSLTETINTKISSAYIFKGSVDEFKNLPSGLTSENVGYVYNVEESYNNIPAGTNYAWDGEKWDALAGIVDLSIYTTSAVTNEMQTKIDAIESNLSTNYATSASVVSAITEINENFNNYATTSVTNEIATIASNNSESIQNISGVVTNLSSEIDNIDSEITGVKESVSALTQEVIDNKEVTSQAINTIVDTIGLGDDFSNPLGTTIVGAIKDLQDSNGGSPDTINGILEDIDNLDSEVEGVKESVSALTQEVIDNEEVVANALATIKQSTGLDENGYSTLGMSLSDAIEEKANSEWVSENFLSTTGGTVNGNVTLVGNIYIGDDNESMLVMNRNYYNRFIAAKAGGRFAWRVNGQIDDVLVLDESGYLHSPIGFIGNLTGNADSASLLKMQGGTSSGVSTWRPLKYPTKVWGQYFVDTAISEDCGDIVYYLRNGEYYSGSTELCIAIDGDYYAGLSPEGNPYKVLHAGNYTDYCASIGHTHSNVLYFERISSTENINNITTTKPFVYEVNNNTNLPTNAAWHQIFNWGSGDPNYGVQMTTAYVNNYSMYFRHLTDGYWHDWREILDSYNYTTYCAPVNHTHGYLPLSGGIISGGNIAFDGGGLPVLNNAFVPAGQMGIAANGILISGKETCSDGAAIFLESVARESNRLIIGLGDDANNDDIMTNDYIAFRYYGTDGVVHAESKIPKKTGVIALTSDIPTKVSQLSNDVGYTTATGHTHSYLQPSNHGTHIKVNNSGWPSLNILETGWDGQDYTRLFVPGASVNNAYLTLYNSGAVYSYGNMYAPDFCTTSDARLKDFVGDVEVDFNKLKTIPKKYYYWKDKASGEDLQIGTSAQDLKKVYPTCVQYDEKLDKYSVNYQKLSVVALAAIDKLHEENEELRSELNKQKEELESQKELIKKQQEQIDKILKSLNQ